MGTIPSGASMPARRPLGLSCVALSICAYSQYFVEGFWTTGNPAAVRVILAHSSPAAETVTVVPSGCEMMWYPEKAGAVHARGAHKNKNASQNETMRDAPKIAPNLLLATIRPIINLASRSSRLVL